MAEAIKITPEKQEVLDRALSTPDDENSRIIIRKARERGWLPSENQVAEKTSTFTPAQVVVRKFGEGLTGGLSNLIAGGITGALTPGTSASETIRKIREESRQMSKDSPLLSGASEMAGIVSPQGLLGKISGRATKAISGIRGASKATPILARIAGQTLGGGAYTASSELSKGSSPKDAAKEILDNMALSAGLGAAAEAATGVSKGLKVAGTKILASLQDIRPESIQAYARDPKAVNQAIMEQMKGEFIPRFAEEVQSKISEFVSQRANQLDEILASVDQPVSIKPLISAAEKEIRGLSEVVATPLRQKQIKLLGQQLTMLKNIDKGEVSASQVQEIKKQLQEQLQSFFESAPRKLQRDSLDIALGNIEKAAVKTVEGINPKIDKINEELSRSIQLQKDLKLGNVLKGGLDPEKARRMLGTLSNDAKSVYRNMARELDDLTGTQLISSSRLFRAAQDLTTNEVLSVHRTGRSLLPILLGAGAGGLFGEDAKTRGILGAAGAVLGSPLATKPLIQSGRLITQGLESVPLKQAVSRGIFEIATKKKEGGRK